MAQLGRTAKGADAMLWGLDGRHPMLWNRGAQLGVSGLGIAAAVCVLSLAQLHPARAAPPDELLLDSMDDPAPWTDV